MASGVATSRQTPPADLLTADRDLLDGFRGGKGEALTRIYRHHVDEVAALIRRGFVVGEQGAFVAGLRDAEAQRDLVQEIFLRAFSQKGRQAYDGLRPYRPFLLRIAKNAAIDRCRKQARSREDTRGVGDIDQILEQNASLNEESPPPEEELSWQRMREATVEFLANTSQEVQRFVRLRFDEERSQAEVAAELGITRRRVRTLESRTTKGLQRYLGRRGLLE